VFAWQAPGIVYRDESTVMHHKHHKDGQAYQLCELENFNSIAVHQGGTFDMTGRAIVVPRNFFAVKDLPRDHRSDIVGFAKAQFTPLIHAFDSHP